MVAHNSKNKLKQFENMFAVIVAFCKKISDNFKTSHQTVYLMKYNLGIKAFKKYEMNLICYTLLIFLCFRSN